MSFVGVLRIVCYSPKVETTRKKKIIVIVGPTASGKTALSLTLAKHYSGEVISADSRQVYRGLDVGTEKITKDEQEGIQHHLLDVAEVTQVYTASDFKRDAEQAINTILTRGNLPIVAGGTFFYIETLLGTISLPEVPPNETLRERLSLLPAETLYNALTRLDASRAKAIDPTNKRRLIRALEIIEALGRVPQSSNAQPSPYDALLLGIDIDPKLLRTRIQKRAQSALTRGLIEETKQLITNGVSKNRLSEIGLEYPLVLEYLDGAVTKEELLQKLEEKNWQYAKRQRTWLKRMEDIVWITPTDTDTITKTVDTFLNTTH